MAQKIAILLPALLLCGCAEQMKQLDLSRAQNGQATPYGQSPGFSSIYGFVSKEQRKGLWKIIFRGNEFTSFQRAIAIAELRSTQQASANGFGYYRFKVTRKKVHCPQGQLQYTSDNEYQIAVEGETEASTVFQPGMNDTKASTAKLLPGVQSDPSAEAKNGAYQAILDDCAGIASLGAEYFKTVDSSNRRQEGRRHASFLPPKTGGLSPLHPSKAKRQRIIDSDSFT